MQPEEYDTRKVFITFSDAVTAGVGFAVGTLIAYFVIAVAIGIVYGIIVAASS